MKTYGIVLTNGKTLVTTNWDDAKKFIATCPAKAAYRKFTCAADAEAFVANTPAAKPTKRDATVRQMSMFDITAPTNTIESDMIAYVDGSFNINTGVWGAGVVMIDKNGHVITEICEHGEQGNTMRNVMGEISATLIAIDTAVANGCRSINVCYDYAGIEKWATGEWRANNEFTKAYKNRLSELSKQIAIRFTKIAAHTGVEFNERADAIAKKACGV